MQVKKLDKKCYGGSHELRIYWHNTLQEYQTILLIATMLKIV